MRLKINRTPKFDADLERFMKRRGFKTKSEALRTAVIEAANALGPDENDPPQNAAHRGASSS